MPDPAERSVMSDYDAYERRLARALEEMRAASLKRDYREAWFDRLLRRCGLRLRPLNYYNPWQVALVSGLYFSLAYGGAMYLLSWRGSGEVLGPLVGVLVSGAGFGAIFGTFVAIQRRRYRLSRWQDL
jgi:hypothetical protein